MPLYRQKSGFAYFCGFLRTFAGFLRTFAHTKKNIISPKNPPKWRGGGGVPAGEKVQRRCGI